jgi:hypothetical protein
VKTQKRTNKRTVGKRATKSAAGKRARSDTLARPARLAKSARPSARGRKPAAKPASKRPTRRAAPSVRPARRSGPRGQRASASRWLAFVERHGVVLASARGPVPSVAEAVAGQPIIGSWWAHPRGKAIFAALSEIDDAEDVRCFKLVDGKVTFVHRRLWPALARLASDGTLAAPRVASIQQEHMPTGEHRNLVTPFPDWVPDDVARAASALTVDDARAQLGPWV